MDFKVTKDSKVYKGRRYLRAKMEVRKPRTNLVKVCAYLHPTFYTLHFTP